MAAASAHYSTGSTPLLGFQKGQRLGLDIGNVLSAKRERNSWHRYVDEGAYAFLLCYGAVYGFDTLYIITRVDGDPTYMRDDGSVGEHWVLKFLRKGLGLFDLGMPEEHAELVKERTAKAAVAARMQLSVFVDDHPEVLRSIHRRIPNIWLIHYDNRRQDSHMPAEIESFAIPMMNWRRLALRLGIPPILVQTVFDSHLLAFPPFQKHMAVNLPWVVTLYRQDQDRLAYTWTMNVQRRDRDRRHLDRDRERSRSRDREHTVNELVQTLATENHHVMVRIDAHGEIIVSSTPPRVPVSTFQFRGNRLPLLAVPKSAFRRRSSSG